MNLETSSTQPRLGLLVEPPVSPPTSEGSSGEAPIPALRTAPLREQPPAPTAAAEAEVRPTYGVVIHLAGGELLAVETVEDEARAHERAREVVFDLTRPRSDEWPFYAGRFIRPEAIVSVDIVAA